jgi:acetyl-CoA/propionyl-CoA carboxylase biotin carboxyl carrier protein
MEQSIQAPHAGVVTGIDAPIGQTVPSGHVLLSVVDPAAE